MSRLVKLMAVALVVGGFAAAAAPWRIARATVSGAFSGGLASDAGAKAVVAGPVTFKLLPRPRLQAAQVSVSAEDGAVLLDAPLLKADLDIPALLRGAWRISAATLVEPTLTVDLDRLAARAPGGPAAGRGAPVMLRLRSGLLRTRSATGFADLVATGIDASATWSGDGGNLVLSGTATLRGTTAHFAGALQSPAQSLTPAGSSASLQVASPLFEFSADGVLSGGTQEQFTGRASLATASLPKLMRTLDGFPVSLASKRAQISGDLVAKPHDLSLSNAQLRLDRARFEGTLAWRRDAGRGLVAGTLATDLLDLDALAGDSLDAPKVGDLYGAPLTASPFGTDLDMRVSATVARFGRVTLEDAALAALVRGNRLELTLDEAAAYGGTVKARAVATLGADGIDAHADLSSKHLDLGLLSEGLSGHERVGGAMTAHAALDGRGDSLRDVVADLKGDGQIGVEGGRLAGLALAQALRRLGRRVPLDADRRGTPTTFDRAHWDVSIRDGVVRIPDGKLTAPGVSLSFGAETGLPDGRVDVHAVAAQTDASGAPLRDGQTMPFDMRGFWAGPLTLVGRGAGGPAVALPLVDGLAAGR
ncbi:AsmA family protein [Lichenibacterium minor]|uniref:AsmA family protein n=1 Tax=Lichenibacterium minor TaxID=2316528 RepID=A0A4Q2U939_9HYPH|nr:AsmA-like C-terminal region-containing protein [Lichenibacterium minor]RYC33020.1 AsmA family protein [Lichenibacterium minor]